MARRLMRRGAPLVTRGARRSTDWLASFDVDTAVNLAAGASQLNQSFTQAQINALGPFTIVRTVGYVAVRSDQVAAERDPFGAMGMMIVREQARVIGITALPTPVTNEFDDGFFVFVPWIAGFQFITAAGFQDVTKVFQFDSRAQRKVSPDDAIVVTLENAAAVGGADLFVKFRMLVKLS